MPVKRIPPKEAAKLLEEGWTYVDVRSVPEFESGHPSGAWNIPLMHFAPGRGMSPNPEFAAVFQKHFGKDDRVILGCKTSGRSLRAAELLSGLGYTSVVDMQGGFEGERDASGRVITQGWKESGLPVDTAADKSWDKLK